jgi:enoyl-CoA hydratase
MAVLSVERLDHLAVVTLQRADARNALNPELIVTLARTWDELAADDDVWVVVLTGAPGSTFCSGFDLATFIPLMTRSREPLDDWDRIVAADLSIAGRATLRDVDLGKPLVVAANGHAIAGGMEMLLAGDLRVGAAGSRLGLSEVALGLIPAMGGTARLGRHLPPARAAELLLTARPISSEQALEWGLLNRVVPAGDVLDTAVELARTIAGNAPLAARAARQVLRRSADLTDAEALALEAALSADLSATADAVEGPRAFVEKRPPRFEGR